MDAALPRLFRPAGRSEFRATAQIARECGGCGLLQTVPALRPREAAQCTRCGAVLRRTGYDPTESAFALNIAALGMFLVAATMTLMTVSTAGMYHNANLLSGPRGLSGHGLPELAVVVIFTTFLAPLLKLCCMIYVLGGLRMARPPGHLRTVFAWVEHLRPWSMIEVYLLGVFVAYVKLVDLVHIDIGVAIYALAALMFTMVAADAALDPEAVWQRMDRRGIPSDVPSSTLRLPVGTGGRPISCHTCHLVSLVADRGDSACPRCGGKLHRRAPNCIARTWALTIAAMVLYIPANYYPVLTVFSSAPARRARFSAECGNCLSPACTRSPRWCSSPVSRSRC